MTDVQFILKYHQKCSRRCHLLEDLVLGVSFYCLALFDDIEDKMNEKAIVYSALSTRSVPTRIPAPQKAPFYLSELVAESLSLIPHEGIEVETGIEPTDTMLYADRVLMSQVMVNLLKNATEALLAQDCDCKITIRSTIDAEERIQIEITNNGKAIPAEVAENIFTHSSPPKPTAQASASPFRAK